MITLFCLFVMLYLFAAAFGYSYLILMFGLIAFGIKNKWKIKHIEPYDYRDEEHMNREIKRLNSKANIQLGVGIFLLIIVLI